MKQVIVIDDEPSQRMLLRAVLEEEGWEVLEAGNGREGLDLIAQEDVDVVILDIKMPVLDGLQVLEQLRIQQPDLPVVMLTAFGSVGSAVEAMKKGAFDYLTKPADIEQIKAVAAKAYEYGQLLAQDRLEKQGGQLLGGQVIGRSLAMQRVLEMVSQVAPTEANVLITGESGTGKELIATALHEQSLRKTRPLIKVNCAALPAELLESELFGYLKGAFTGAVQDKPGRFQLADQGTLFLDEIGELDLGLQAKLLRALQEKVVEPLGSISPQIVDVRFIAATNRNLVREVEQGRFRQDLFYRLNVVEITLPPLRDRLEDLPLLANYFLRTLGEKNRKAVRSISPAFLEALKQYPWPGNIRELQNVLERAIILSRSDCLDLADLPPSILDQLPLSAKVQGTGTAGTGKSGKTYLDQAEKEAILQALKANGGHRERTAQALGISRRTLQYKLKKHGLVKKPS